MGRECAHALGDLSDDALVTSLRAICSEGNRVLARLIVHLGEVEERGLHRKAACPSMFDYCVRRLGMSEGAAFRRIAAARLTRKFPSLLSRVERGEIHLSALVLIRDLVTASNVEDLASEVSGKSKREVQQIVAVHAPKPDVPAMMRKLPERAGVPTTAAVPAPVPSGSPMRTATPWSPAAAPKDVLIEPLSESRYKLQLTASADLRAKLERATDLMRHRNPTGDMAVVIERALDALLATLEKERLGATRRPQRQVRPSKKGSVARSARREVFARDGEQCMFRDDKGDRCVARALLGLDHIEAKRRGGSDDPSNLRVFCRAHSRLHAEEVVGREHVAESVDLRQRKSLGRSCDPANGPSCITHSPRVQATQIADAASAAGQRLQDEHTVARSQAIAEVLAVGDRLLADEDDDVPAEPPRLVRDVRREAGVT